MSLGVVPRMSDAELIGKMRGRVEQCRRLARMINDDHTRRVLLQMADEAEADMHRFEAEHGDQDNDQREA